MRKKHVIKKINKNELPRQIIYFDTETYPNDMPSFVLQRFRLGVAVYKNYNGDHFLGTDGDWLHFNKLEKFYDFIEHYAYKNRKLYVVAHNLDFDYQVINAINIMYYRGWELKWFAVSSNLFTWEWVKDGKKVIFLDSMQLLKGSIKNLGKLVGVPKMEMPAFDESDDVWFPYCQRDVEVLATAFESYLDFILDHDLGSFGITISAQAFHAYKKRFMSHSIVVHGKSWLDEFERQAYHGGRTEAFYIGKVREPKIYDLDINSMYPYVMKSRLYPVKYRGSMPVPKVSDLEGLIKEYAVIADVDIETDEPVYPVKRDKLIFPVGRFRTVLNTPEIEYALQHDHIRRVHRIEIYDKADIFSEYINFFYELKKKYKQEKNYIYYKIVKLFQNSLYGKFGQQTGKTVQVDEYEAPINDIQIIGNPETHQLEYNIIINGKVYQFTPEQPAYDAFIAIASHVTAYARVYLWKLIKIAGRKNVYYCDTDSLFTNKAGMENLKDFMDDLELGKLKIEGEFNTLEIRGLKDYKADIIEKIKGVPRRAVQLADGIYQFEHFTRFRSALSGGVDGGVAVTKVTKRLERRYDKGIVGDDGWVSPFRLIEF